MNQKKIEKDVVETAAIASPIVIAASVAAFAGAGYLLWVNRARIQKFFKNQDLGATFGHMGELVSEGASKVSGLLHNDVKPLTNSIGSSMDKVQHAAK
jgi:hypothetical protein